MLERNLPRGIQAHFCDKKMLFVILLDHSLFFDREADIPFGYGNQQQKQCKPTFFTSQTNNVHCFVRHND